MATVTLRDGLELFYRDRGEGPHSVVFLNGLTQTTAHWQSHVGVFAEDFRVITYDARGQGETGLGDREISLEAHARDLAELLEQVGIDEANLVGFSHGARVALGFARLFAETLEKLVLCSLSGNEDVLAELAVEGWRRAISAGGLETLTWVAIPMILGRDYLERHGDMVKQMVRAGIQRNERESIQALLEAHAEYPSPGEIAGDLEEIETLVLSGSEDVLVSSEGAEVLATVLGARHEEFDGIGHTVPIEAPEAFRQCVRSFL